MIPYINTRKILYFGKPEQNLGDAVLHSVDCGALGPLSPIEGPGVLPPQTMDRGHGIYGGHQQERPRWISGGERTGY